MKRRIFKRILALSFPAIIANVAAPVLSMSDMAVAGRMGSADSLAAIALGGVIFNLIYWLLGFLRMGASGLTAQAYGAGNERECVSVLARSLAIALATGLVLIIISWPLVKFVLLFMDCTESVRVLVEDYFFVCILGAPAMLSMYAFSGWYVGIQDSRVPMWISIVMVAVNIATSVTLVFVCGWGVRGVAAGTALSQWIAFFLFSFVSSRRINMKYFALGDAFDGKALRKFFRINADIFLRTLCMIGVTFWFTRAGSHQGTVVLAANSLIMQFFTLFSFVMDGFAYAGEGICGAFAGARDGRGFRQAVHLLLIIGIVMAFLFSSFYFVEGEEIISFLSHDGGVNAKASEYLIWAVTIPLAGFAAFIWDGISVGLVATRAMMMSLVYGALAFFAVYALTFRAMGNHGVWLAFVIYLIVRGIYLWVKLRNVKIAADD